MNSQGRSSHASSQASLSDQMLDLPYDVSMWPESKALTDYSQLNHVQLPPISPFNQQSGRFYPDTSYHRNESNLGDIDQLPQINTEQIRGIGIDALTRPLNEQPYQVGMRMPAAPKWSDQSQYSLSRSMTEPMHSHIDELMSTTGSELLTPGVSSLYYTGNHTSAFATPRAKTVIQSSSQKDSVIGSRQLQRTVSTNTSSQRSRGPGSTGTARRRSMGPPPPCSTCGKVLKNQSDVTKHAKSHSKPYKCTIPECPKHIDGFSTPNDRDRHERSKHRKVTGDEKDRGYVCSACTAQQPTRPEKWWPRLDNFKSHIEKKHSDHNVGEVIRASLRDRRPDDDTLSIAHSNCISVSHADTDLRYQHEFTNLLPQSNMLSSSQQGENWSCFTESSVESHELAGIGQAQSADYALIDRKHNTVSHGCNETDEPAVFLRPSVLQPVRSINKDDHDENEETKNEDQSLSPTTYPKNEEFQDNHFSYCGKIDRFENCKTTGIARPLKEGKHGNQLRCLHKRCHSTFGRECDRRKHEQRHIRPYGCTWPKCYERHGSKSDWIRHEKKVHMLADRWLCMHTIDDSGKQCRACFWKENELRKHILANHKTSHHDLEELVSKDHIDSMYLGRQGQVRFWCGFCCAVIENHAHAQGKDSFTARCDHIGAHIDSKGGRHIQDWVCVEFMMRKEELMKVLKRTGKHPDPYGYDKVSLAASVQDEEWKKAVSDVDVIYSAMHTASFSRMKDVSFKNEPI